MRIAPVGMTNPIAKVSETQRANGPHGAGFKDAVKKAVAEVNELQTKADDMAVKLASGEVEDVHEAMIAMQKAKLALDFTIQVRNKVIEAYQEIMRMQV